MPLKLVEVNYITILAGIQLYGGIAEYAGQKGYESYYSYHKKLNVLKTYRDEFLVGFPRNIEASHGNLPGMEKSFAVGYFERVERVLNVLYEKKLLD